MIHDRDIGVLDMEEFAALGNDAVAYLKEMSANEVRALLPEVELPSETIRYWALFAADGTPIMLADQHSDILEGAFQNDLHAILPN